MILFLLAAAMAAVSQAQTDCSRGACYPPKKDILLGRAHKLRASSTCGLTGSEVYCTPYQQRRMKCCPCDSRNPKGPLAHTVQDVVSTAGPNRWWQSRKGESPVSLSLDLDDLFQLDNLVLSFKGPRPAEFVIERTLDNGSTWKPALYMATDCQTAFPGIPTLVPLSVHDTYCHTLPATGANPYQDQNIEFSPLRQYANVPAADSQKVEDVSGLTGLRVRMTGLGDVPHQPGRALSRFYALKEMKVMGSCLCHGHANRCLPETGNQPTSTSVQVSHQCECQHHTAGVNCERCADLYNDLPWRPAEENDPHACKRCDCNNHAQRCRFDPAAYEVSGRRSGGVCEGCLHHTTGPKCEQCAAGFQQNPRSRMDRPDACISCVCSAEGTVNGGRCDPSTDACRCKANVEGPRCDRCKRGYYGLDAADPLGCTKCSCSPDGSLSDACDPLTGQCSCQQHFRGLSCELCSKGYWKPLLSGRCERCDCDPAHSLSDACDQETGRCQCRPNVGGRRCSECPEGRYGDPLLGCRPCRCDAEGTVTQVCHKQTGACLCRPGVTGARCDSCGRGHCDSFPACETCPSCFFTLDAQMQNLSSALGRLSSGVPSGPADVGDQEKFMPRVRNILFSLDLIKNSITLPLGTTRELDDALSQLDGLRNQVEEVHDNLSPLERTPGLDSELDKLRDLLNRLAVEFKDKKDAVTNSTRSNTSGAFSAIQKAYNESTEAAGTVRDSEDTLKESADVRKETADLRNRVQPVNTRDLEKMNQSMAARPDLTPVAKQVCGDLRSEPCTPLQCDAGRLCPLEGSRPCETGQKCVGALSLSRTADVDTKDVKGRLDRLSRKITEAAEKLQETQDTTNQVRESAEKLSKKMKQAQDQLEDDLKEARDVVEELKDFLSDPTSNLTHIQKVSDWILKTKLPVSLKRKLEELKSLADNLPDSTAVLNEAEPKLDTARRLLREAEDARDTALGVKAKVDGLLSGFGSTEGSLSDLEDRLQDNIDQMKNLNNNLQLTKDQLEPAEKALDEVSTQLPPMKPQLVQLRDLLQTGGQKAQDAQNKSDSASDEADSGNQDLLDLEKKLALLKAVAPPTPSPGGGQGGAGERLAKLKQDAGALANTTADMIQSLEGKADSLRKLQDEILQKSTKLEGLDEKLQDLLAKLQKKAIDHSKCKG